MDSQRVIYSFDSFPGSTISCVFDDDTLSGFDTIPLVTE